MFGLGIILFLNYMIYLNKILFEELYLDSNRIEIMEIGVIIYYFFKFLKYLFLGDNKIDNGIYYLELFVLYNF